MSIKRFRIGDFTLEIFQDFLNPRNHFECLTKIWCIEKTKIFSDSDVPLVKNLAELKANIDPQRPMLVKTLYDSAETLTLEPNTKPVGFIFILENVEKPEEIIEAELDLFNKYLEGRCYGFRLVQEVDCIGGFFGEDPEENGMANYLTSDFVEKIKTEGLF